MDDVVRFPDLLLCFCILQVINDYWSVKRPGCEAWSCILIVLYSHPSFLKNANLSKQLQNTMCLLKTTSTLATI